MTHYCKPLFQQFSQITAGKQVSSSFVYESKHCPFQSSNRADIMPNNDFSGICGSALYVMLCRAYPVYLTFSSISYKKEPSSQHDLAIIPHALKGNRDQAGHSLHGIVSKPLFFEEIGLTI